MYVLQLLLCFFQKRWSQGNLGPRLSALFDLFDLNFCPSQTLHFQLQLPPIPFFFNLPVHSLFPLFTFIFFQYAKWHQQAPAVAQWKGPRWADPYNSRQWPLCRLRRLDPRYVPRWYDLDHDQIVNMPILPFMNNLALTIHNRMGKLERMILLPPRSPISYLSTKLILRLSIDGHLSLHAVCRNPP